MFERHMKSFSGVSLPTDEIFRTCLDRPWGPLNFL